MDPVIDRIAEEIKTRLESVDFVTSVVRPKRINDDPAGDRKLTLTQGSRRYNQALSYPSQIPVVAWDQVFVISGELRPSETDDTPIDTLRNRFDSEIRAALTGVADWHTFGGNAVNADIGAPRIVNRNENTAIAVDLLIQYRHPENDATEQR